MRFITIILGICCVFLACSSSEQVRSASTTTNKEPSIGSDTLPFPHSWTGTWQGDLEIFKDNQLAQTVPMQLEIEKIDTSEHFTWSITYGADGASGTRAYQLEIIDPAKGHYRIDERNSILLESYLFGNRFLSWYEVMGNQILSRYEKKGDQIHFEIIFGSAEPISITGNEQFAGEDIPPVRTFPVGTYQYAVLQRK